MSLEEEKDNGRGATRERRLSQTEATLGNNLFFYPSSQPQNLLPPFFRIKLAYLSPLIFLFQFSNYFPPINQQNYINYMPNIFIPTFEVGGNLGQEPNSTCTTHFCESKNKLDASSQKPT